MYIVYSKVRKVQSMYGLTTCGKYKISNVNFVLLFVNGYLLHVCTKTCTVF